MKASGVLLKSTKARIGIAAVGGGCVVAAAAVFALSGEESFRTIAVEELHGTTIVANEKSSGTNAYEGMHLYSGDDVTVQVDSDMMLLLDMDKYVYAEENTHFWLKAEGDDECGNTVIYLDEGSELNRIKDKLEEGESYEVDTPNSTMAVRGTVFRVSVYYDAAGMAYTSVEVFDGSVQIDLKTVEGEYNGVTETFEAGEAALIRGNTDFSEFVTGEDGSVKQAISYHELPKETARKLVYFIDDGEEICIERELLQDYTALIDHQTETVILKEASCAEEGEVQIICTICGEVMETTAIPKKEHQPGNWEITKEAACTTVGERVRTCSVCGDVVETEEIPPVGHVMGNWETIQDADCTVNGIRRRTCSVCGAFTDEAIPALGHKLGEWQVMKEPTCTETGEQVRTCSVCGDVVETEEIALVEHVMGNWETIQDADCTVNGIRRRTCSVCGAFTDEAIPALGHKLGDWQVTKEPTCTTAGEQVRTCSVCGDVVEAEEIAPVGHMLGDWKVTKEPTCTTVGEQVKTCSVCGDVVETEEIAPVGHTLGEWQVMKEPTCTETGEQVRICSVCGDVVETEEIPLVEHVLGEWEITKEATCTEAGEQIRYCMICEEPETESIPPKGHSTEFLELIHRIISEEMTSDDGILWNCNYEGLCLECEEYIVIETGHIVNSKGFCETCGDIAILEKNEDQF